MDTTERTRIHAVTNVADRRSSPRVAPVTAIAGTSDSGDRVTLMNVSEGGFMIHGPTFYTLGHMHEFEFGAGRPDGPLTVIGRVVHVVRVSTADGQSYVTGLEFCAWTVDDQRRAIEKLVATARNE
jgi:hypothetical protein